MKYYIFIAGCFFCLALFTCNTEKKAEATIEPVKTTTTIDTINIVHKTLPVKIDVAGYIDYWKEQTIYANDSSQIISILVEENQKVIAKDYLLSLWQLNNSGEYTPVDIKAPFTGIVEKIYVKIGSRVAKKTALLYMYNDDFLSINVKLTNEQLKYVKHGQHVINQQLNGYVESVDRNNFAARILLKNKNIIVNKYKIVRIEIVCGNIKGDFVLSKYFDNKKNLIAYIDDESSFKITQTGYSDSLSLISPPLPHLSKISIINHNTYHK